MALIHESGQGQKGELAEERRVRGKVSLKSQKGGMTTWLVCLARALLGLGHRAAWEEGQLLEGQIWGRPLYGPQETPHFPLSDICK